MDNDEPDLFTCKCTKCGRKILVSILQFGVSHIEGVGVICESCIDWNSDYAKENPDIMNAVKFKFENIGS